MMKSKGKPDGAMAQLLASEASFSVPKVGELVRGVVLSIGKSEVLVNIGGLLTGVARGVELEDEMGLYSSLKIGDQVEGKVLDIDNEDGRIELSFRSASHQKAWNSLQDLKRSGENVSVEVMGANKGGVIVKLHNVMGFMPVSQLAAKNYPKVEGNKNKIYEKLQSFVGSTMTVKVIDVSEAEDKLIVSEKEAEADERLSSLQKYSVGDTVDVTVKGVVDFGLFVEFGSAEECFEGLIHVSELSWQSVNPHEVYKIGDTTKAQIVSINRGRVALSLKRLTPNPWKEDLEKFKTGETLQAMVVRHEGRGVIVEALPGLEVYVDARGDESLADGTSHAFTIADCHPEDGKLYLSALPKQQEQPAANN